MVLQSKPPSPSRTEADDGLPPEFLCPISHEVMKDPVMVVTRDGSQNPSKDFSPLMTPKEERREASEGMVYQIKLELLSASNLPAANMSGTSDPYAVISCGDQKRFSSVVPGSRNPMWGENFDFHAKELPVTVTISMYDWDIIWKSQELGTASIVVKEEGEREVAWVPLDGVAGQVCVQLQTVCVPLTDNPPTVQISHAKLRRGGGVQPMEGEGESEAERREGQVGIEVRQKPGPLQTIFDLPPDEVVLHSYSCALERLFLYHGRMFVSAWHVGFHSNVFGKNMSLLLLWEDIEEMHKSQHAFINPALTITLKAGAGGHGVPPLSSPDGRVKYKFASFWNRGHVLRALHRSQQEFYEMARAALQEEETAMLRSKSNQWSAAPHSAVHVPVSVKPPREPSPFLQEALLTPLLQEEMPCSAEQYWEVIYSDQSKFVERYRGVRKDTELEVEPWHDTEEYGGLLRKITFRSLCNSPMCPPTTKMTEWQHCATSPIKDTPTLEIIQEAHDVPFGSYFEVQARWQVTSKSAEACQVQLFMGVHFKKWCGMQSKIRNGAANEYKADAMLILDLARKAIEEWKLQPKVDGLSEAQAQDASSEQPQAPGTPPLSAERASKANALPNGVREDSGAGS